MSSADPIDYPDQPKLTAEHITKRVDDWLSRIDLLFSATREWAGENGWTITEGPSVPMREEFMQTFGVKEREQPTISLKSPDGKNIWIKPKGLWVIGANGRIDIFSAKGAFVLVDMAEHFKNPKWMLHRVGDTAGRKGSPFSVQSLAGLA